MKLSFYGAAQEVTGSCFLLEAAAGNGAISNKKSTKILIDCGLFQCPKYCDVRNAEPFPFKAREISAVFVSHAHVDHTGRIPKLIKEGFHGRIYSTNPTKELAELMLKDSIDVLAKEASRDNGEALYTEEDADKAMEFWEGKNYGEKISVGDSPAGGFTVSLHDAGHILGSAMIEVVCEGKKILFSGDLGNPFNPLLSGFEKISGVNYLLVEATYGDRVHEDLAEKKLKLERVIEKSVMQGGVLMIPAFSLERTQELLWEITDMLKNKQIPNVPIFLDSPLAIRAGRVYEKYHSYLNKVNIKSGSFSFLKLPNVKQTLSTEESKSINNVPSPKIIIAGSGMSTGGRILHHERRYLQDPKSTILFIGYQAPGSLGRRIQDGADFVKIFREEISVRCHKEAIHGYSAHPDENTLFDFVQDKADTLERIYTVHAEPKASFAFVQKVRDYLGIEAFAPKNGETVEI